MQFVAGIDSSTQSTKVVVVDVATGKVEATTRAAHPTTEPPKSEQDPRQWWNALETAFSTIDPSTRAKIVAVSVSGQQHGLVLLDHDGSPLRPAKLWNDTESAPQADRLVAKLGAEVWADRCGVVPVPAITVTKLAWVADVEPHLIESIRSIMLPHDYLTWRLSGNHVTDRGDASGTGWWDPASGQYQNDLLTAAGANRDLLACLPEVLGPTDQAGPITPEAAAALGLSHSVIVGPGSGDNMAAALGLGLRSGEIAMSLGTSGTVFGVAEQPAKDEQGFVAGFADATGHFLPLVCTLNATKVTDMVAATIGADQDEFAELSLQVGPGAGGVTLVPYFDGERTPNLPTSTGLMTGLRPTTSRAQLARAAHEGVLCNLLEAVDALAAVGVTGGNQIRLVGGGSKSVAYRQILADLTGASIRVPDEQEAPAIGAAVQAAVATGHGSFDQVTDQWGLRQGGVVVDPAAAADEQVRNRYREASKAAASLSQSNEPSRS